MDFFFIISNNFYEIYLHDSKHYFVCIKWVPKRFDRFLNSTEIVSSEPLDKIVLNYEDIEMKQTYEKKKIGGKSYIIADTLDSLVSMD